MTDADGNVVNPSSFNVTRSYINITGQLSHVVAFRITPDVVRESGLVTLGAGSTISNDSLVFRVKYAFAQINLDDWMPKGTWVRLGIQQTIWPEKGLALSLGGRIDGLPVQDVIGGDYGFRRPGYSVYIEPGVNWVRGDWTVTLAGPVAVYHNRPESIPEQEKGINRGGGFADFLILASVMKRF